MLVVSWQAKKSVKDIADRFDLYTMYKDDFDRTATALTNGWIVNVTAMLFDCFVRCEGLSDKVLLRQEVLVPLQLLDKREIKRTDLNSSLLERAEKALRCK